MFEDMKKVYERFKSEGFDDPLTEMLRIFNNLYGNCLQDMRLLADGGKEVDLDAVVAKRKEGTPIEYILSSANFMGRSYYCTKETLIPTPETKVLVEAACDIIRSRQSSKMEQLIFDIGTGCGNIAISIATSTDGTKVYASDISPGAVAVARKNIEMCGMEDRVKLLCGDLFDPFKGTGLEGNVDVIVCNPPYMPTKSVDRLPPEVRDQEPRVALDAGTYGIDIFVKLLEGSLQFLKREGILIFEIGESQDNILKRLIKKNGGFTDIKEYHYQSKTKVISIKKTV